MGVAKTSGYWKKFRTQSGLSQMDFAKSVKTSYSHYTKLEGGFVNPSFELLCRIKKKYPSFDLNELIKIPE